MGVTVITPNCVGAIHACTPKCGVSARRHELPLHKIAVFVYDRKNKEGGFA